MDDERAEQNRKRYRALAVQIKRALITAANGVQQWLDADPDEPSYEERIVAGDSRKMPRPENRPPAFVPHEPREPDDTAAFRAHDRLMRQAPDPNGRLDRP